MLDEDITTGTVETVRKATVNEIVTRYINYLFANNKDISYDDLHSKVVPIVEELMVQQYCQPSLMNKALFLIKYLCEDRVRHETELARTDFLRSVVHVVMDGGDDNSHLSTESIVDECKALRDETRKLKMKLQCRYQTIIDHTTNEILSKFGEKFDQPFVKTLQPKI